MTSSIPPISATAPALSDDPLWYKDAIIYELHVRAFRDSNNDGIGDFPGLVEKLDYLADLGVTAIWLLPFYPSPLRDGGYDISDYYGVHENYGTLDDFKRFMKEAHQRGIRVITELVINHTSSEHPWFQKARTSPPGSKEREMYTWSDTPTKYADARIIFKDFETSNWTWDPIAKAYYWHRFYSHQPDLNFDNPDVHEAIFKVVDFWMEMGVDGVRLDAVPYLYEREGTICENLDETHAFLRKLRAHIDSKFKNRMLLAEANQWPSDAAAYFGQGDECHMNFHFPLMPRLFMALHSEDAFPIVDILRTTPQIPESCQWATFLRNHDELTLEMVTDEDRDYMYRVYALEDRARINLGIRRRLFPLLRERRRVELLNSLLFALPGTPVLYYGDEIGMGDNIYLGDRDGVRTPMQWSSDRNAGFSSASPQRLYLPVILEPEYHYEAINVEAQQANPSSLLWWMKRLMALRKQHQVLSRGSIRFLEPDNNKVVAFVREDAQERMLYVANLSRFTQCIDLDLADYRGLVPVEMFGRSRFPHIERRHYRLTLGAHDSFWFLLQQPDASEVGVHQLPPLTAQRSWRGLATGRARGALAMRLARYAATQRWFRSKALNIKGAALEDIFTLPGGENDPHWIVLLGMELENSVHETYVVPLRFVPEETAHRLEAAAPASVVAHVIVENPDPGEAVRGALVDAVGSRAFAERLREALKSSADIAGEKRSLKIWQFQDSSQQFATEHLEPRFLAVDQSNSTITYGSTLMLKMLRLVEEGMNVELELGRFLAHADQRHVTPRILAAVQIEGKEPRTVALLSEFIENRGTAWNLTLESISALFERVLTSSEPLSPPLLPDAAPTLADGSPPEQLVQLASPYFTLARLLGERTAELHIALASDTSDPAFAPEPFTAQHQHSIYHNAHTTVVRGFSQLRKRLPSFEHLRPHVEAVLASEAEIESKLKAITTRRFSVTRIRCHGDYHLGQVLFTGDDFVIIDFEGEPMRPLRDRRYKRNPLRDVAGMVRSFDYAMESALRSGRVRDEDLPRLLPWAIAWREWVTVTFVRCYLARTRGFNFVPSDAQEIAQMLEFYQLEKALYELGYELNNRPDWLIVPMKGLMQLLGKPLPL